MRQVFSSQRLENVEAVAEMLRAEGIEVRISNERSYRGNRRSNFSYRESDKPDSTPHPAVWIVNAEDQPRGRQILRDAGLLQSTREGESSYLPLSALPGNAPKGRGPSRAKLGLLALIAVVIGLIAFGIRMPATTPAATAASSPTRPAIVPQVVDTLEMYRADVPTALAKFLLDNELAERAPTQACIAIDGRDPPPALLQSLSHRPDTAVVAKSACGDGALAIDVREYTTDGSGVGNVQVAVGTEQPRSLDVERNGDHWRLR